MNTRQLPEDFPEVQSAIYGMALALDSFLINGILFGVFPQSELPGFLEKVAGNMLRDLARLETQTPYAPLASQLKVTQALAALRAKCQQIIDLVAGLRSFRTLPPEQLRSMVSQIPLLREACVQQIQELEACFQVPKPFYPSRPAHSTRSVNDFLANLENIFIQERNTSVQQSEPVT